jgi:transcriptional regulator GlxA family with amidase domain
MLLPDHPAVLVMTSLAREAILALTIPNSRTTTARARLRRVIIDDIVAAPEQPLHLPEPRDDRLRAVKRHVERDLSSPDTLADIGRTIGVGERTLSRLFHEETGMSFRQWRTQLRIHHSLILLAEGASVIDVAVACGWANPSAFITVFTNLVGQTPGKYRRAVAVV